MQRLFLTAGILVTALCVASPAWAETVDTLGTQAFSDGDFLTGAQFATGNDGFDPFNGPIGIDGSTETFQATWTHTGYGPLVGDIVAASITFGIWEHDSAAPDDQVASFTLDGLDLTAALNALLNASGGGATPPPPFPTSEYNVYTLALPASTFTALADDSATFALELQNGSLAGTTLLDANGAGLDFSTLRITTREVQPVIPEPSILAGLLSMGAVGLLGYARRRRRNCA